MPQLAIDILFDQIVVTVAIGFLIAYVTTSVLIPLVVLRYLRVAAVKVRATIGIPYYW